MKRVRLCIQHHAIAKVIGHELELFLPDDATVLDAIRAADERILRKGPFPSADYRSVLHWTYNPVEARFYEQAAIIAYSKPGEFLNVRDDPTRTLPDGVVVHVNPEGPCITSGEDVLDHETFTRSIRGHFTL
jgi:hypothetical protein